MHIEFGSDWNTGFMEELAGKLKREIKDNIFSLPPEIGEGFSKKIDIDKDLRFVIHSYNLNEPMTANRKAALANVGLLTFRFLYYQKSDKSYLSNVQVLNDTIDVTDYFPPHTSICYVIVKIRLQKLLSILEIHPESKEFSAFTNDLNRPFIYQESMTPEMRGVLMELSEYKEHGALEKLYCKIKIMELLYHFFIRFSRRATYDFMHVNKNDIEKILGIERIILQDLRTPPKLPQLARSIGMCESKMKQLFKKIYGDSIYNYYLSVRMNEAASLLKNDKSLSVSEVGYALGFSNLSHFAQLFKRYIGVNPKEYAMISSTP